MTAPQTHNQIGSAGEQVWFRRGISERGNRLIESRRTQVGERAQGDRTPQTGLTGSVGHGLDGSLDRVELLERAVNERLRQALSRGI